MQEIKRVKGLGSAAGIYARGIEWHRPLTHPEHWPIYEEVEHQDLPITVHVGNGSSPMIREMFQGVPRPVYDDSRPHVHPLGTGLVSGPYVLYAFQQILGSTLLGDFPKLRVGFLEAGADWTVRLVKGLRGKSNTIDQWLAERVFVSCAIDDDIPYIKSRVGDDFLVTATDFPHGDAFRQDQLAKGLQARGDLTDKQ